jgi:hypothetical protein
MCKLMEYSPTTPMTDDCKLTLLKNAVQDASHLASMESAYDVTTWLGSGAPGAINYNGYMEVLLSASQNHDTKISPTTHDPRIDVPMLTRHFLQNPMMRNSTTLIPVLTLYGLMLIILYWHTTATVHEYLMTRDPNFCKILGTSG